MVQYIFGILLLVRLGGKYRTGAAHSNVCMLIPGVTSWTDDSLPLVVHTRVLPLMEARRVCFLFSKRSFAQHRIESYALSAESFGGRHIWVQHAAHDQGNRC